MIYVLDSNIALKWVLPESDSGKAKQLRDDFGKAVHELLAPDVFQVEIAHALTRAERQGRIATSQAALFWADSSIRPAPFSLGPSRSPQKNASASMTASTSLWRSAKDVKS